MFDFEKTEKQFELGSTYRLEFTNINMEYPITSTDKSLLKYYICKLVEGTNFIRVSETCWVNFIRDRDIECPRIEIVEDILIIGLNSKHYGDS